MLRVQSVRVFCSRISVAHMGIVQGAFLKKVRALLSCHPGDDHNVENDDQELENCRQNTTCFPILDVGLSVVPTGTWGGS